MKRLVLSSVVMVCAFAFVLAWEAPAYAAADPAVTCESVKLIHSAVYGLCRLKAEAKALKKGLPADYGRCVTKFAAKWAKVELTGGNDCPTQGVFPLVLGAPK